MEVSINDAKLQLSRLIECARAGVDVVIADRGEPLVRLIPVESTARPTVSGGHDIVKWLENNPLPAYAQLTAADIDASIAAERSAWD